MRKLVLRMSLLKLVAAVAAAATLTITAATDVSAMYLDPGGEREQIYLWTYEDGAGKLPDGRSFCLLGHLCDDGH